MILDNLDTWQVMYGVLENAELEFGMQAALTITLMLKLAKVTCND